MWLSSEWDGHFEAERISHPVKRTLRQKYCSCELAFYHDLELRDTVHGGNIQSIRRAIRPLYCVRGARTVPEGTN